MMIKMKIAMPLISVLCLGLFGCALSGRDIVTTPQPWHGELIQKHPDGKTLQVTEWNHGKLVSCWEFSNTRWVNGEFRVTKPKWTQTVSGGNGRRTLYDERGEPAGREDFKNGECTGGSG
jgi:hypothetical protein